MPAASWFSPVAPILAVPDGPPWGFTACTFAWSYRYAAGQLDAPPTAKMIDTDMFSSVFINGHNDESGRSIAASFYSSGWASVVFDFVGPTAHLAFPGGTNNFVLRFNAAGLGGGIYGELWHNGVLVMTSDDAVSDVSFAKAYFMGDRTGTYVIPGETQGYWWSNDTAMDPATMFADLFNGSEGMRDLNANPAIGGVTPDSYHMEPGESSGVEGTVSGTISLTGSAAGTVRSTGSVAGTIGLTGAASGSVRSIGTVTGTISLSGAATGSAKVSGSVAGTIGLSGSAAGTVRDIGSVSGSIGLTGSATGSVRDVGTVSGTIGITGSGLGSVRDVGTVSGTIGISGSGLGSVRVLGTVNGSIGLTGEAFGAGTAAEVSGEISGTIGITGEALGRIRVIGTVEGTISISGIATDQRDTSKQIEVTGFWTEHSVEGFWAMRQVEGSWRQHAVQGVWV